MITVKLMGGMGNQMFQYAMGLAQARRLGVELRLDISLLGGKRVYQLNQWRHIKNELTSGKVSTIHEQGMPYNQALVDSIKDGDVLEGYWQSERYFIDIADTLQRDFFPSVAFVDRMMTIGSPLVDLKAVAVHVRCGDYLTEPTKSFHGTLPWEYYQSAMNYIREKVSSPKFFFFSDDPEWVREHFYTDFSLGEQSIVKSEFEAEDIFLGSQCRHVIIANSSFSWWMAWLGREREDRIVIAPRRWFLNPSEDSSDIVPSRWTQL